MFGDTTTSFNWSLVLYYTYHNVYTELAHAAAEKAYAVGVAATEDKLITECYEHREGYRAAAEGLATLFVQVMPTTWRCSDWVDDEGEECTGCGYFVLGDEDGCCVTCGGELDEVGTDLALAAYKEGQQ